MKRKNHKPIYPAAPVSSIFSMMTRFKGMIKKHYPSDKRLYLLQKMTEIVLFSNEIAFIYSIGFNF